MNGPCIFIDRFFEIGGGWGVGDGATSTRDHGTGSSHLEWASLSSPAPLRSSPGLVGGVGRLVGGVDVFIEVSFRSWMSVLLLWLVVRLFPGLCRVAVTGLNCGCCSPSPHTTRYSSHSTHHAHPLLSSVVVVRKVGGHYNCYRFRTIYIYTQ